MDLLTSDGKVIMLSKNFTYISLFNMDLKARSLPFILSDSN